MKFTIYRESWRRGGDSEELVEKFGDTALLNSHNMLCCLGQCAIELGADPSDIRDIETPKYMNNAERLLGTALLEDDYVCHTLLCTTAMSINDGSPLGDAERERRLTEAFAVCGHEIEFVDGVFPALTEKLPAVVAES